LLENNPFSYQSAAIYEKWTLEEHLFFRFSIKKRIHGHQLFGVALQPFLSKVTNTANIRVVVVAVSFFSFQSTQETDYAMPSSPLMFLLNLIKNQNHNSLF